jgi:hypothetical protein
MIPPSWVCDCEAETDCACWERWRARRISDTWLVCEVVGDEDVLVAVGVDVDVLVVGREVMLRSRAESISLRRLAVVERYRRHEWHILEALGIMCCSGFIVDDV